MPVTPAIRFVALEENASHVPSEEIAPEPEGLSPLTPPSPRLARDVVFKIVSRT